MQKFYLLLTLIQVLFSAVVAIYFYRNLRGKGAIAPVAPAEAKKELEKLRSLRAIYLTTPLSEQTRPKQLSDIVGQEQGIKALRAALCSPNPQHVLIYGPPGVGKTAAARLMLEEAKKIFSSPFGTQSRFVEVDATTLRFDERSIADPLMGSVHDPIYQGAGAYGAAGIPQPKPGAVTQAHGGILFIDEIGELHPVQMNKLLKVLEDRVARFQSAYYSESNAAIPAYIHDIFKNGLPADFRLIGATTRSPQEIPPALRSRCTEIFFEELTEEAVGQIAANSVHQAGFRWEDLLAQKVAQYASSGREAVNIIQMAASVALMEKRREIVAEDLEWVFEAGRYQPMPIKQIAEAPQIGVVNALAVYGEGRGALLTIESWVQKAPAHRNGSLKVTGIVEEEEIRGRQSTMRRKSTARGSVENVLTALEIVTGESMQNYDIHINFPGGLPMDGPSAGTALFCSVYSALSSKPLSNLVAMTGEIGLHGEVLPVGGVRAKLLAAKEAGATMVYIPEKNWVSGYQRLGIDVRPVRYIHEILKTVLIEDTGKTATHPGTVYPENVVFTANPIAE